MDKWGLLLQSKVGIHSKIKQFGDQDKDVHFHNLLQQYTEVLASAIRQGKEPQ